MFTKTKPSILKISVGVFNGSNASGVTLLKVAVSVIESVGVCVRKPTNVGVGVNVSVGGAGVHVGRGVNVSVLVGMGVGDAGEKV